MGRGVLGHPPWHDIGACQHGGQRCSTAPGRRWHRGKDDDTGDGAATTTMTAIPGQCSARHVETEGTSWSGPDEVLASGQDDRCQHRSEKEDGKKPSGYCPIHRTDAHDLANCYIVMGLLEKDQKCRHDHNDNKDKDDGAVGLGF
ncbi:hypothetical protein E2562_018225 [Oryza meyeriana var. granulata]|uniref:Uncharacterized protein n=1 Tax=Oryza meyeriana var. granulata TaxID=110450 RepID=A0A6G1CGS0_9ORYZ|nr:hypothetical protein E2562_018225 [Oryza meyeriana var. granulata]